MKLLTKHRGRWAWTLALAVATAACQDSLAPGEGANGGPGAPSGPSAEPVSVQKLDCTASVTSRTVRCGDETPADSGRSRIVFGGQNLFVKLTSANPNYDAAAQHFTFDVTVRNLIPQPLGTADTLGTLIPEPEGVRVFFTSAPVATSGTGVITVLGDGTAPISTAEPQAYYQYNTVLEQYEVSAPKTWTLHVPATVGTFSFTLLVSAPVPRPTGYVDIMGNFTVRAGEERTYAAVPRNALGVQDALPVPVVFASADTTLAAPIPGTGRMHGMRGGTTLVQAFAADGRTGKAQITVRPRRRIWMGTTSTDWHTGTNWYPDNVVPTAVDTAVFSDTINTVANRYPALVQNTQIGGLEVQKGVVALGAFNLTATGAVFTDPVTLGSITSSSGRLVLSGTAQTVRGTVPRLLVNGVYSLSGNLLVNQQIRVQGGRLRNQAFRVRVVPN